MLVRVAPHIFLPYSLIIVLSHRCPVAEQIIGKCIVSSNDASECYVMTKHHYLKNFYKRIVLFCKQQMFPGFSDRDV